MKRNNPPTSAILVGVIALIGCSSGGERIRPEPSGGGADLSSDPANCGSTGHSCLGGTCSAGTCQAFVWTTLGDATLNPVQLAIDPDSVYVGLGVDAHGAPGGSSCAQYPLVLSLSRKDGSRKQLAACDVFEGGAQWTSSIALGGGFIYWVPAGAVGADGNGTFGTVHRTPVAGGSIATFDDQTIVVNLVADAQAAFYFSLQRNAIVRLAHSSTTPQNLVSGSASALALDDANLYMLAQSDCMAGACKQDGWIRSVPKSGGASADVATKLYAKDRAVWAHDGYAYFTSYGSRQEVVGVARAKKGGAVEMFSEGAHALSMQFDAQYAYWTGSGKGVKSGLLRQTLDGSTPEFVADVDGIDLTLSGGFSSVAMDDIALVWNASGSIWMLAK